MPTDFQDPAGVDLGGLRWIRLPGEQQDYRLLSGENPLAELRWAKPHGSLATLSTSAGGWTFKRSGFLQPVVSARSVPDGSTVARISSHLGRGLLELTGSEPFRLQREGMAVPGWQLLGADGNVWVDIEPVSEKRRLVGGVMTVAPNAQKERRLLLLLGLCWYFIVLLWFEDELFESVVAAQAATW